MQFPTLTTQDLNGKAVTLPNDFQHQYSLLFVAYLRWHQDEVDSWLPFAQELEEAAVSLRYYEMPVVGRMDDFGRKRLDFIMQRGIPNVDTRSRTLTYYVDRTAFRAALGLETEEHIGVVLVNQTGGVLWREYGRYSAEKASALIHTLQAIT